MKEIRITDIQGIQIGSAQDEAAATGCTVIIAKDGAIAGVDVRGGAPATRETDLLDPLNTVEKIHAVMLSGGSAFGLDACSGAMKYLEEQGCGFDMQVAKIPIVCGASLFDLTVGRADVRPDQKMGYDACLASESNQFQEGNYGAGCGASVGKLNGMAYAMKGGLGTYGLQCDQLQVASIVAVNACGQVIDHQTQKILAGMYDQQLIDLKEAYQKYTMRQMNGANTTIGCVVTNAKLNKAQCTKIAGIAHNGYALSISPVHTTSDGDTIFVLSTNEVEAPIDLIGVLATQTMAKAIENGIKKAQSAYGLKAYCDI